MASDAKNYQDNLQENIKLLEGALVEKILFRIDDDPAFDMRSVPFSFKYCYSACIVSDKGNFIISASMTDEAFETLWIRREENSLADFDAEKNINCTIKKIITGSNRGYAYKIDIDFGESALIIIAGEIYEEEKGLEYVIPDEMLFVFESRDQAVIFEQKRKQHP